MTDAHVNRYAPWPADAAADRFCGTWNLWQRRGGHRTSADDLICAWTAADTAGEARTYCDLGCGIGSVLLMTTWALRPTIAVGVEAQAQSVELALRSIGDIAEPLAGSLVVLHSDFRSLSVPEFAGAFDVITGSPPYLPVGTGVPSPDPQRFACRFETRGGVEAYMETAAGLVADAGIVVIVFQTIWTDRVVDAGRSAGFDLVRQCDFRTRADRPEPFLSTYVFRRATGQAQAVAVEEISIRDASGEVTSAYGAIRARLGLGGDRR